MITHFNRENYVSAALRRLNAGILCDPTFKDRVEVIVVDNSKSLEITEDFRVTHIVNENYGGSGGFARGLMYLEQAGSFTHCLFMDDDASCEVESIKRCYALLSYAKSERFAIAGALLNEIESYRLIEKGAKFGPSCRSLKAGLDVRAVGDLLLSEKIDEFVDYGAWWFFAFSLRDVNHYPFPFFVRGDDITFGFMNGFNILTMNGISVWGDDFAAKSGPVQCYLDTRYHTLVNLIILKTKFRKIAALVRRTFFAQLYSYNYSSASAICLALEHICRGPDFFERNLNLSDTIREINSHVTKEKMHPIARADFDFAQIKHKRFNFLKRAYQSISLNGALGFRSRSSARSILLPKRFAGDKNAAFHAHTIVYEYEPLKLGYVARLDRKIMFVEIIKFLRVYIYFVIYFFSLKKSYKSRFDHFTSRTFWEDVYK
ncbi:MAG: glycosyltransferase [Labrys sp. (in: a-proteobacteria)]